MILIAGVALIVLVAVVARVPVGLVGAVRFRAIGALVGALVMQVVILQVVANRVPFTVAAAVHLASYVLAGAFLWANRHVPGLWVLAAGGAANFAAIAANGGVMPASTWALAAAGHQPAEGFANSMGVEGARLAFLGDVFAWPDPLPLANVFSVGDVLLLVGAAVFVFRAARPAPQTCVTPVAAG